MTDAFGHLMNGSGRGAQHDGPGHVTRRLPLVIRRTRDSPSSVWLASRVTVIRTASPLEARKLTVDRSMTTISTASSCRILSTRSCNCGAEVRSMTPWTATTLASPITTDSMSMTGPSAPTSSAGPRDGTPTGNDRVRRAQHSATIQGAPCASGMAPSAAGSCFPGPAPDFAIPPCDSALPHRELASHAERAAHRAP